jgi:hypothetical protein
MHRLSFALIAAPLFVIIACGASTSSTSGGIGDDDAGGTGDDAGQDAPLGTGTQCTQAFNDAFLPIKSVSTGVVSVVTTTGDTKEIYVDASGGGIDRAPKAPRVYLDLANAKRVDVTDVAAMKDPSWDLALKRDIIFTNSGDGGVGGGGAVMISKTFASVTKADADAAKIQKEKFFDDQCKELVDEVGAPQTTFSGWYDYDQVTHIPTPKDVTFIVRSSAGVIYKLAIAAYDGLPDGGSQNNVSTGFYLLKVAPL